MQREMTPADAWNAAIAAAIDACERPNREGRAWVPGSFWDNLIREQVARIRAIPMPPEIAGAAHAA